MMLPWESFCLQVLFFLFLDREVCGRIARGLMIIRDLRLTFFFPNLVVT